MYAHRAQAFNPRQPAFPLVQGATQRHCGPGRQNERGLFRQLDRAMRAVTWLGMQRGRQAFFMGRPDPP